MTKIAALSLTLLLFANAGIAGVLEDMSGAWNGTGWARETPLGPKEAVRCRLKNTYDESAQILTVSGRCAVPGRKIALAGEIKGQAGSEKITGHWFNPDGLGSVRIFGAQRSDVLAFSFKAKDPETGADVAQNIEWRVIGDGLRLRASDRSDASIMMSDMSFQRP